MECFAATVNGFWPLNIIAKLFILDYCESPGYGSDLVHKTTKQKPRKKSNQIVAL